MIICPFDSTFDGTLLNLNGKISICDVNITKVCRDYKDEDGERQKTLHNIVVFHPGDNGVIFEQKKGKGEK